MSSLFARYVSEREGKHIIEKEHGFATYVINQDEAYIEDIYVTPDMRQTGYASQIANEIEVIAKARGCKFLTGTVVPSANGSTESLKVLLSYGFKLHSAQANVIYFVKELKESK